MSASLLETDLGLTLHRNIPFGQELGYERLPRTLQLFTDPAPKAASGANLSGP
jgi:hypothetical protein